MNNAQAKQFTNAQIDSCILLLKEKYANLKGYKEQTGQSVKTWQDAANKELDNLKQATQTEEVEVETFDDMPLSLTESLKGYDSTIKAFKAGTVSRETVNTSLQAGLLKLADSGNKDFSLLTSILWLMYTEKGWKHDYVTAKKYIEAVTPFIVLARTKDVVVTSETAQDSMGTGGQSKTKKELVIRLSRKKGYMWRKRPPAYWDSLRSFKQNGKDNRSLNDPSADAKKAAASIERALGKSLEAELSATKRIELAADLLGTEETSNLASHLHNAQHNFEEIQKLKSELSELETSESEDVSSYKRIARRLSQLL